jgi:putative NADH-flavin reductase
MKIALIGASGTIGQRIAAEAKQRGHSITAISRKGTFRADVTDPESLATAVRGHDAVVLSTGPVFAAGESPDVITKAANSLLQALPKVGVKRLIVVGGAGGLRAGNGQRVIDSPHFPDAWKPVANAAIDALEIYRANTTLDWTVFSPAAIIEPGLRTGKFRLGTDTAVSDAKGNSHISAEDYAVALVDELERPQFIRKRFTIGY